MHAHRVSRRRFLQAGAASAAAVAARPPAAAGKETGKKEDNVKPLPRRKLGRSRIEVTILDHGEIANVSERHLNILHQEGVRCLDLSAAWAKGKHERAVGEWLNRTGRRKDYVLVTKDYPATPRQWASQLDQCLENGRQEYYDLYFIHGLAGDGPASSADWPRQKEWAQAAEAMKKAGKARLVGFSACCDPIEKRAALLRNAAEGGWVDAIMVAVDPLLIRDNALFNKALDACHEAGIGLIAMKTMRGLEAIRKIAPGLEARGLSRAAAVLTAVWTDERFSTISVYMDNITKLKENAAAARGFKPMNQTELAAVHRMLEEHPRRYCVGCDGRCRRAAGTQAALNEIARYLCYYEENGNREVARRLFAALPPEARDWSDADLLAASRACICKLDFARILARAAEKLA